VSGVTKTVASYGFTLSCATVRSRRAGHPAIVFDLLTWFAQKARDLPWRRTGDPYAIWVSEIMLQQTQVKTVIPFWQRWMERLPTIESLARARSQTIHKLWEGLGYYTRVRNMQKAARVIVRERGGKFPADYEAVLSLPGIGRYTAGAICSIAFNQPTPILDGNVIRVLTRLFGIPGDPKEKTANDLLWERSERLVKLAASIPSKIGKERGTRSCSLLNQALMELGALICTPRQPKCDSCPVRKFCVATREGLTETLPEIKSRPATTRRSFVAFVLSDRERFLIRQRPQGVVNGHLWEFPNLERNGHSLREECRLLGGDPDSLRPLCEISHSITRYRISLKAYQAVAKASPGRNGEGKWLMLSELDRLPFTSAHKQILKFIRANGNS